MKRALARHGGFTLIELLVTVSLVGMIGATVVASVIGCLRVWERIQSRGVQDQWVQVAFDQIRTDLRNIRRFSPEGFNGSYEALSFPALTPAQASDGSTLQEIGVAGYYFDQVHHVLCRSSVPYRLSRKFRLVDTCDPILEDVARVRFSYYAMDPVSNSASWKDSWESADPPLAVKVEVGYDDHATKHLRTQTLLAYVPASAAGHPAAVR